MGQMGIVPKVPAFVQLFSSRSNLLPLRPMFSPAFVLVRIHYNALPFAIDSWLSTFRIPFSHSRPSRLYTEPYTLINILADSLTLWLYIDTYVDNKHHH